MIRGADIICISWLPWENVPLVMHQMMRRLRTVNRVLFVDPPVALSTFLFHPGLTPKLLRALGHWVRGVRREVEGLSLYAPPPLLFQYGLWDPNDRWNQWHITRAVRRTAARIGFRDPLLWIYSPFAIRVPDGWPCRAVVYDCNDDVASTALIERKRRGQARLEGALIARADLVFATSRALHERLRERHPRVHYLPSGVDVELFARALDPSERVPSDLEQLPPPRIGYLGGLDRVRIDWDLLRHLAQARPAWSIVLVGPAIDPPPPDLRRLPNLHLLGPRPQPAVPGYLKGFDVGIIPFRLGPFTRSAYPTKALEYLAAGRPVVTVEIPAVEELGDAVRTARSGPEFVEAVEMALREGLDAKLTATRAARARGRTWEARVEHASTLIEALLVERRTLSGGGGASGSRTGGGA